MAFGEPPGLSISKSLSPSSAGVNSPFNITAPEGPAVNNLQDFFIDKTLSPPAKAETISMQEVEIAVNLRLLPIEKSWDDLHEFNNGQAKISFLVLRQQPEYLSREFMKAGYYPDVSKRVAEALWNALDERTPHGQRLAPFFRRGGDLTEDAATASLRGRPDTWEDFLEQHPVWKDHATAPTIFNNPDNPCEPFLLFQEGHSSLCHFVAIVNALYYSMSRHSAMFQAEAVQRYALNISRFMRNECSANEIFDNIFAGKGGYPDRTLLGLLKPWNRNTSDYKLVDIIRIDNSSVSVVFENIKYSLEKFGALVIEAFKVYPEFVAENGISSFYGSWEDKDKFSDEHENRNSVHTLLVVGARLTGTETENMGGIELLVQNSWQQHKTFVTIGYDLLRFMGVTCLFAVPDDVEFRMGPATVTPNVFMTQSRTRPSQRPELDPVDGMPEELVWGLNRELPIAIEPSTPWGLVGISEESEYQLD
jgi:hypothetical protein